MEIGLNEHFQEDYNNIQLELLNIQEKLIEVEKGLKPVQTILPKLLNIFYKVQVFSWKVNPDIGKLVKGAYVAVAVALNNIITNSQEQKKQEVKQEPKLKIQKTTNHGMSRLNSKKMSIIQTDKDNIDTDHFYHLFQRDYVQKLQANDTKICKQFEQFIKCVKGIQQNSQSFFKSVALSQQVKVQSVQFVDNILSNFADTKEKLSNTLQSQYSVIINQLRLLLSKFFGFKQQIEKQSKIIFHQKQQAIKMSHNIYESSRKKNQSGTQSLMTIQKIYNLQRQLQTKIIELQAKQKQIKHMVDEIYNMKNKVDRQDIEKSSQNDEIKSSMQAYSELQQNFMKVCEYAASVEDHHFDMTDQLQAVSNLGLQQYVDQRQFNEFSVSFKVSLFSVFKKIVSKYSKITNDNKKKVVARRSTLTEGNLSQLMNKFRSKKTSLMNPTGFLLDPQALSKPLKQQSQQQSVDSTQKKTIPKQNNTGKNQSGPTTSSKRLPKGSIRRLGYSFGLKNDGSNDQFSQLIKSNMHNKIDSDGLIENSIPFHKSIIKLKSDNKQKQKQIVIKRKSQQIIQQKQKPKLNTKSVKIISKIDEDEDFESSQQPVHEIETKILENQTNKKNKVIQQNIIPSSSKQQKAKYSNYGLRKNINDLIQKASNDKKKKNSFQQQEQNSHNSITLGKTTIGTHFGETLGQFIGQNRGLDRNKEWTNGSQSFKSSFNSKHNSFKQDKFLPNEKAVFDLNQLRARYTSGRRSTKDQYGNFVNSINMKFGDFDDLKQQKQEDQEDDEEYEGIKLIPSFSQKKKHYYHSRSNSRPDTSNAQSENDYKENDLQTRFGQSSLPYNDKHRSSSQGYWRVSNVTHKQSFLGSKASQRNSGQLKKNKLFMNQLKLILDIPMAMLNKRLRQINDVHALINQAQQLHIKKCGSSFCPHLLRFYETFRKIPKQTITRQELKPQFYNIGIIQRLQ